MKVTDEILKVAGKAFRDTAKLGSYDRSIKVMLEAVFSLIEKDEPSIVKWAREPDLCKCDKPAPCINESKRYCGICCKSIAKEQPDNEGWISGKKGACPVDRDVLIEVKYPDGSTDIDSAYKFHWNVDVRVSDPIIAYRILPNQTPEKKESSHSTWVCDKPCVGDKAKRCTKCSAEKEKIPTFKEYRYLAECCAKLEVRIAQLEARKS